MVTELLGMFWIRAREKNLEFHVNVSPEIPETLVGDEVRIKQMLINLINNAVKNTQAGSEIRIISEQEDSWIYVHVKDNGPGISDSMKPHIFEMFYTGQNDVSDGRRGIGLGLALCKSIVEAHGGTIILTDNDPSGCCFTFSLPAEEVTINE